MKSSEDVFKDNLQFVMRNLEDTLAENIIVKKINAFTLMIIKLFLRLDMISTSTFFQSCCFSLAPALVPMFWKLSAHPIVNEVLRHIKS